MMDKDKGSPLGGLERVEGRAAISVACDKGRKLLAQIAQRGKGRGTVWLGVRVCVQHVMAVRR